MATIQLDRNGRIGYKKRVLDRIINDLTNEPTLNKLDEILFRNIDKVYFINEYIKGNISSEMDVICDEFIDNTIKGNILFQGRWI